MIGSLLGVGGASLQTSTTQTAEAKTNLTQGAVTFGAKNIGGGGGNTALYVAIAAGVVIVLALIFKGR